MFNVFSPHHLLSFGAAVLTFCGDLLFVPSGINHPCLRTFAAWGITATAGNDCPGQTAKVFACFRAKTFVGCAFTPGLAETVVAVFAPGDRGLTGEWHRIQQRAGTRRNDEERCAKRRCPSHPGGLLPGCRERGHGATRVARPERSLQARGFGQGWKPARAETASLAPFTTSAPPGGRPGKARAGEEQN